MSESKASQNGNGLAELHDEECVKFQDMMSDRIRDGEDLSTDEHIRTCKRCRGLLSDLMAIAEAARDLFKVELDPADRVWAKIQSALPENKS